MRWTTTIGISLLLLLQAATGLGAQEKPNPDRRPPGGERPEVEPREAGGDLPDGGREAGRQSRPEGDDPERPDADGSIRGPGLPRTEVVLPGGERLNVELFSDPAPLPRGGSGTLYIKVDLQENTFLTRGPGETRVRLPAEAGVFDLGDPLWPPPAGNFTHAESGAGVPGWTEMFFIRIPVTVASSAEYGRAEVDLSIDYRLMSTDRPRRSSPPQVEKVKAVLEVGPPRPQVVFPSGRGKRAPAGALAGTGGTAGKGAGREPEAGAGSGAGPDAGRLREPAPGPAPGTASPGGAGESPLEEMDGGGLLGDPLVVFGLAGVLLMGALLLLFRRR